MYVKFLLKTETAHRDTIEEYPATRQKERFHEKGGGKPGINTCSTEPALGSRSEK